MPRRVVHQLHRNSCPCKHTGAYTAFFATAAEYVDVLYDIVLPMYETRKFRRALCKSVTLDALNATYHVVLANESPSPTRVDSPVGTRLAALLQQHDRLRMMTSRTRSKTWIDLRARCAFSRSMACLRQRCAAV